VKKAEKTEQELYAEKWRNKNGVWRTEPQHDDGSLTYKLDQLAKKLKHTFPNHTFIERMVEARKILDLNYEEMRCEQKTIYR
jgi:hypothetical protein